MYNRIGHVSWLADPKMRQLYRHFGWLGVSRVASRGLLLPVFALFLFSISFFTPLRHSHFTDATNFCVR